MQISIRLFLAYRSSTAFLLSRIRVKAYNVSCNVQKRFAINNVYIESCIYGTINEKTKEMEKVCVFEIDVAQRIFEYMDVFANLLKT